MYSFNTKHPVYVHSTLGCKCLRCFTDVYYYEPLKDKYEPFQEKYTNPTARTCRCKDVGIAVDTDGTLTVFVEDIRAVHLGSFIFDKDSNYVRTEWLNVMGSFYYTEYNLPPIEYRNKPIKTDKPKKERPKTYKKYNKFGHNIGMLEALTKHNNTESRSYFYDGWDNYTIGGCDEE